MKISELINNIFRQDFKNHLVLGRSIFGVSIFIMGAYGLLDASNYASYAPSYIPFSEALAILTGLVLVLSGILILANSYIKRATSALIILFLLFILLIHLPTGDVFFLVQNLSVIGAALIIRSLPKEEADAAK